METISSWPVKIPTQGWEKEASPTAVCEVQPEKSAPAGACVCSLVQEVGLSRSGWIYRGKSLHAPGCASAFSVPRQLWMEMNVLPRAKDRRGFQEMRKDGAWNSRVVNPPGPGAWQRALFPPPARHTLSARGDPVTAPGPCFFPLCFPDSTSVLQSGPRQRTQ